MTSDPDLVIVTGSSRGMGEALALQAAERGARVLGLARQRSERLASAASALPVTQWTADLADSIDIAARVHDWLHTHLSGSVRRAVLVNNAALLARPGDLASADWAELAAASRVGLEAVVVLSAAFLRATAAAPLDKRICNISSGLGRRAMAGSASYCAVKAGMDHFSRALALEEADKPQGAKVVSLAPGIIDTDMQVQLRGADPNAFKAQSQFADYHASGALTTPHDAAERIWRYIERADFGANPVADVRDA
jgi:benzil reductase ((S)-benzoin forming)